MSLVGLRPGEKLYEEKLMAEEGLKKTKNDLIHIMDKKLFCKVKICDIIPKLPNLQQKGGEFLWEKYLPHFLSLS